MKNLPNLDMVVVLEWPKQNQVGGLGWKFVWVM